MARPRVGGSFAPPLPPERLESYKALAASAPEQVRGHMEALIRMLEVFRETPDSVLPGTPHPSGVGTVVPLHDDEVKRIWDHVPWGGKAERLASGKFGDDDCDQYAEVFEAIPNNTQKPLRDAAFHLLWFARELSLDREPLTADRLGGK